MENNESHINLLDFLQDDEPETKDPIEPKDSIEPVKEDEIEKEEDDNDDTEDSDDSSDKKEETSFWEDVEKITGEPIEGKFDDTIEGAIEYIKAVKEKAKDEFEETFAKSFPEAYELALYMSKGGDPSKFFFTGEKDSEDYESLELSEDDEDTLKQIVTKDLKEQGLSDKRIKLLIESMEESDELFDEANLSKQRLVERQKEEKELASKEREKELEVKRKEVSTMIGNIEEVVKEGKVGNFIIPMTDRDKFKKHLLDNISYENGKFLVVSSISDKNIKDVIAQEFFKYKNGDLSAYIDRSAETKAVKRLKQNIQKEETKHSGASSNETNLFSKLINSRK